MEYAGGDYDAWTFAGGLAFHPIGELRLIVGPGFVHEEGTDEMLVRLGASYGFPVGDFFIAPTFNVDLIEEGETAFIYGINFGYGF